VQRSRFSLRLLGYMALLLVSVGSITWAIADLAAGRERARADAALDATLRDVVAEYADVQQDARVRALTLARSRTVQRALARRDRAALRRLSRTYPEARFLPSGEHLRRRATGQAARVLAGGRLVGEVQVPVPLDGELLKQLRRGAVVPPRDILVLNTPNRAVADPKRLRVTPELRPGQPMDVGSGTATYRGLLAPIAAGGRGYGIAVLRPKTPIDVAARELRDHVLYAGIAAFFAVAIVAYAAAPAVGRSRLARERRSQAARILSQVRDGVVLVEQGVVRSWNHGAARITGVPEDAVLGQRVTKALPGFDALASEVPVATRPEEAARAVAAPLRLADRDVWLSISAVGSDDGTVYVFRDLTDQRRLERMRDEFVATVSHELRTPLASVYGAALTLRSRASGDDLQQKLVSIVADESERLAQIVEEILLASQLTSGELALRLERVDAARLARRAVEAAQPRLPENVSLELEAPTSLPPVSADEQKARQVLGNLIDNAVKYSPGGGRIGLRVERENGYVTIAVSDEGLGIPASEQERIFQKFYRLDADMARGVGGTGLGLYICRELAERMGGKVRVSSRPGAGSTFFFELPVFT
jgi:signal transduction histidine kinase